MARWTAAEEVARETGIFEELLLCLFGLYLWEVLQTGDFEWSLLTRARKFSWPFISLFLCRYCMLFSLIGVIVAVQVTEPIGCNSLYLFNTWACNMTVLCATTSLMIHTVGLWDGNMGVILPFALLGCAHWAILWRTAFTVEAAYSQQAGRCVLISGNHTFFTASFFTTMVVDLTVVLLALVALIRKRGQLALWDVLFQDGLAYISVPFLGSITPAILSALNLNAVMNVIAIVPAATISAIAVGRLVMRPQDASDEGYIRNATVLTEHRGKRFPAGRRSHAAGIRPTPEVHVTTDRVTFEDFPTVPPRAVRASRRMNSDDSPELDFEK